MMNKPNFRLQRRIDTNKISISLKDENMMHTKDVHSYQEELSKYQTMIHDSQDILNPHLTRQQPAHLG